MPPSGARPSLVIACPTSSASGPGSRTTRSLRHGWTRFGPVFPRRTLPGAAPRPRAAPRTSASRAPPSSSSTRRNVGWITSIPSIAIPRTTTGRAMRASSGVTVVLALTMTLVVSTGVSAHRREDYLQAARIGLEPDSVLITLDLMPGIAVAESFISALDRDGDGELSSDEQRGYAGLVVSALEVAIDEQPLRPRLVSWSFPEPSAFRRGEGTIRLKIHATLPSVPAGPHRLFFKNAHLTGHSAYLANALVPESARVTVTAQRRDRDQGELTKGSERGQRPPSLSVGVVLHHRYVVEDHGLSPGRRVLRPVGKSSPVGIPGSHELQQRPGHPGGQLPRAGAAAGVVQHHVGVVEPEADVDAVEGAEPVVEKRRFPTEPAHVDGSGLLRLGVGERHRVLPIAAHERPDLHRLLSGEALRVGVDDVLGLVSEARAESGAQPHLFDHLFQGDVLERRVHPARRMLVQGRADDHGNRGRGRSRFRVVGILRQDHAVHHRIESAPQPSSGSQLLVQLLRGLRGGGEIVAPGHRLQLVDLAGGEPRFAQRVGSQLLRESLFAHPQRGAALHDRLVEEALRRRRRSSNDRGKRRTGWRSGCPCSGAPCFPTRWPDARPSRPGAFPAAGSGWLPTCRRRRECRGNSGFL